VPQAIPWATATERKNPQRPEFKFVETVFRTEPAIIARIGLGIAKTPRQIRYFNEKHCHLPCYFRQMGAIALKFTAKLATPSSLSTPITL
jgi:hypothetical protein